MKARIDKFAELLNLQTEIRQNLSKAKIIPPYYSRQPNFSLRKPKVGILVFRQLANNTLRIPVKYQISEEKYIGFKRAK